MKSTAGRLVQYINKAGNAQKAIALHADQKPQFSDYGKVFVRLVDDDFEPVLSENKKKLVGLKREEDLQTIGYID